MRPIRTAESNFTYVGPVPRIADLPCRREDGAVLSVWQPTDEERALIATGAQIELAVGAEPHPPVSLTVVQQPEQPADDDRRCTQCDALYVAGREMDICGQCGGELAPAKPPADPLAGDPLDLDPLSPQ